MPVVAGAVAAGAWEGEFVCDAELACEGECVLWRLGDASDDASLEASATIWETWGETERSRRLMPQASLVPSEGYLSHVFYNTHTSVRPYNLDLSTFRQETPGMFPTPLLLCHF